MDSHSGGKSKTFLKVVVALVIFVILPEMPRDKHDDVLIGECWWIMEAAP
jgi:hypothetical protein